MAGEPKGKAEEGPSGEESRIEVGLGSDASTSLEDGNVSGSDGDGLSIDIGGDDEPAGEPAPEGGEGDPKPGEEPPAEGDDAAETVEPLPEFTPETAAQYDERYFPEGKFNEKVISQEFWQSFQQAGGDLDKAGLPESTYKYLESTLGMSKETIKTHERALVALHEKAETEAVAKFGGMEKVTAAVAWGKATLTPAQRQRFNDAYKKGGAEREEAMELLMSRYDRANPPAGSGGNGPPSRPGQGRRDATNRAGSGGSKGGEVFGSMAEYKSAWSDGLEARRAASTPGERRKAEDHLDFLQRKAKRSRL